MFFKKIEYIKKKLNLNICYILSMNFDVSDIEYFEYFFIFILLVLYLLYSSVIM